MWEFLIVIILGTSTWAAYDSHMYQVAIDKKSYAINNGAGAWFFSCILLWPVTFPYYLVRRSSALKAREDSSIPSTYGCADGARFTPRRRRSSAGWNCFRISFPSRRIVKDIPDSPKPSNGSSSPNTN